MTKAMPFLQKVILLSYDPRPLYVGVFWRNEGRIFSGEGGDYGGEAGAGYVH